MTEKLIPNMSKQKIDRCIKDQMYNLRIYRKFGRQEFVELTEQKIQSLRRLRQNAKWDRIGTKED